jgi:urocanate hydratase
MPLLQRCGHPNCPAIQVEVYCPEHARPAWSRGRHPSRWASLSRRIRDERPVYE